MKLKKKEIFIFGLLMISILCLCLYQPFVEFFKDPSRLRSELQSYGVVGELILVMIMCLQVILIFLPGEIVEIAAGYLYGSIGGLIICLLGSAMGSTLIYVFVQKYGMKFIHKFIDTDKFKEFHFLQNKEQLNILCFIVFFIPGTPKDLLTYFIPLTDMKLSTFLFITTIARIPSIITSTVGGNAIGVENYMFSIIVFGLTGIVSLIGLFIYKAITRQPINYNL